MPSPCVIRQHLTTLTRRRHCLERRIADPSTRPTSILPAKRELAAIVFAIELMLAQRGVEAPP